MIFSNLPSLLISQTHKTMNDVMQTTSLALRDVILTFQRGVPNSLIPTLGNLEFTPDAQSTLMNCCGFIAGTYYSGNIGLADGLARNLIDNLKWRGQGEGQFAKIGSDYCHMSFSFLQYFEITESEYASVTENKRYTTGHYNKKYYAMSFNGGIIFHGARHLHRLDTVDPDAKWWSTHT